MKIRIKPVKSLQEFKEASKGSASIAMLTIGIICSVTFFMSMVYFIGFNF